MLKQLTLVAAFSVSVLATTQAIALPVDGQIYINPSNGNYYAWIGSERLTWEAANAYAGTYVASYDGQSLDQWHLVTITSPEENAFIYSTVMGGTDFTDGPVWLGAVVTDGSIGNFNWVTGEPFVFSNFAPGQPDLARETALEMMGWSGETWNDQDPDHEVTFLIEHSVMNPVPEAETYAMMLAGLALVGFVTRCRKV